jgi:hypothetical protein
MIPSLFITGIALDSTSWSCENYDKPCSANDKKYLRISGSSILLAAAILAVVATIYNIMSSLRNSLRSPYR